MKPPVSLGSSSALALLLLAVPLTAQEVRVALKQAQEELTRRPTLDLPPFGRVQLEDEVVCGAANPGHQFRESPAGVSRVETILGQPCRVLRPTEGEASYMAFRLGRWKLLKPGAAYVLAVDYPEDQPRSVLVINQGNETSRGFHTGTTFGDALHPKYVNNNPESLRAPLSGRYETWTLYFNLHDRFPDLASIRGAKERKLTAEDGFDVVIAQFSAENDPASHGAAVSRIRLFEVIEEPALAQPVPFPPAPLPRRHIFWREEMADGVIESDTETERGVTNRLDWYRYKANRMRFLGINTFSKDLLEFGACQHWDPTPYGGNDWVHFAGSKKDLWAQIVALMGQQGFDILPYYEYSGSRGYKSLGYQRRAKPLTRDDAYTHIQWIENANADLTDPDTYADFKKMLDLTVVRIKDQARFGGIWLRPRSQLPMGFADTTRARFAREANGGKWEVHHASPPADPSRYADTPGVLMTHCINRAYTVALPKTFATFRGPSGLALIRHYALNEHMDFDKADQPKLGYFIADIERAGPACMMAEALAVANGDPTLLGYLQGGNYGRGFPQYVREFNANFLALPALPSERLANADPEVVVRAIRTPAHGTYLAVVNTSFAARQSVAIRLPPPARGRVLEVVTGRAREVRDRAVELDLHPFELRTLRMEPSP